MIDKERKTGEVEGHEALVFVCTHFKLVLLRRLCYHSQNVIYRIARLRVRLSWHPIPDTTGDLHRGNRRHRYRVAQARDEIYKPICFKSAHVLQCGINSRALVNTEVAAIIVSTVD